MIVIKKFCPSEKANILRGFEVGKKDKAKRARELEEEIMKMKVVEDLDEEKEDIELEISR